MECLCEVRTVDDLHEPATVARSHHYLGRSSSPTDGYFEGIISYLRIWHGVALSPTDAADLYMSREFVFSPTPTQSAAPTETPAPSLLPTASTAPTSAFCPAGWSSADGARNCEPCRIGYDSVGGRASCVSVGFLPTSCVSLASQGYNESGSYAIYPDPADPSSYHVVYCDQETDAGGWMLTYAYNHVGGANGELVPGVVPADPVSGFSHVEVGTIYESSSYTKDDISEVRFYCDTT